MGSATSKEMAIATLVPLPFGVTAMVLRFYIRTKKKAWGTDDWAMVATVPVWLVTTVSMLGMAYSGVGQLDATLTSQQIVDSLRWFYVFQESWCFVLVTLKWSIGFTLLRIDGGKLWVTYLIHTSLALVTLCTGGTGMYLFFACNPVEKNWHPEIEGSCQPRQIQTVLSFLVAAVSITTDWIFALLPVALISKLQMPANVKLSVIGLLGLGYFASIAPIVRLRYLLLLNDSARFIQGLGIILAWAQAEVGIGLIVANLPACRPFLERALTSMTTFNRSGGRSLSEPTIDGTGVDKSYLELGDRERGVVGTTNASATRKGVLSSHSTTMFGPETKVYGRDGVGRSSDSLEVESDGASQTRIVDGAGAAAARFGAIRVQKQFGIEVHGQTS